MMGIKSQEQGAQELFKHDIDQIVFIKMASRCNPRFFEELLECLNEYPYYSVIEYSAPGFGHNWNLPPRKKYFAGIVHPDCQYVIIDDGIETGDQLSSAVQTLVSHDVSPDNIWVYVEWHKHNNDFIARSTLDHLDAYVASLHQLKNRKPFSIW